MTITSSDAAEALNDVASVTRRVRAALLYRRLSSTLMVWGGLSFVGYLSEYTFPHLAPWFWRGIYVIGLVATILLAALSSNQSDARSIDWRQIASLVVFICSGVILSEVITHLRPRELGAFWPIYFMSAYIIIGLWIGYELVIVGSITIIFTLAVYFLTGASFGLFMAIINGLGLMFAGAWLRRI